MSHGKGYVDVEYGYAAKGEALIEAGHITCAREYAFGPDPFKLSKKLRQLALARFGYDFDDTGSYPRAGAHLIHTGREMMYSFLGESRLSHGEVIDHRELVLKAIGDRCFPGAENATKRKRAKQLINLLEMDGSYYSWCEEWNIPSQLISPTCPLTVELPGGGSINVMELIGVQPARTRELVSKCGRAYEYMRQLCAGESNAHPDRTLKSYLLQECEAMSRNAKISWAEREGCKWISLQHDGVVIGLRAGMTKEEACVGLTSACGAALGYRQPVEVKEMCGGVVPESYGQTPWMAPPVVSARVAVGRNQQGRKGVGFVLSMGQVRRERRRESEDPSAATNGIGPGLRAERSARTRQAQTTVERLRREGGRAHEDALFPQGRGIVPLANLQHVVRECTALCDRTARARDMAKEMAKLRDTVPGGREDTAAFRRVINTACGVLTREEQPNDQGWQAVEAVLTAFVPDFGRQEREEGERMGMVRNVVKGIGAVCDATGDLVEEWKKSTVWETRRRRDGRCREHASHGTAVAQHGNSRVV